MANVSKEQLFEDCIEKIENGARQGQCLGTIDCENYPILISINYIGLDDKLVGVILVNKPTGERKLVDACSVNEFEESYNFWCRAFTSTHEAFDKLESILPLPNVEEGLDNEVE